MNKIIGVTLVLILSLTQMIGQTDASNTPYEKGANAYAIGQYNQAIEYFLSVYNEEGGSVGILFNLGCAYHKAGDFSNAALYYEKAKKLSPFDDDIQHNISLLNDEIGADITEIPDFFLQRYWKNFTSLLSTNQWTFLFVGFGMAFLVSLFYWLLGSSRPLKKKAFFTFLICLTLTAISLLAYLSRFNIQYGQYAAIVMKESIYLKSGPNEKSIDTRYLPPGVKVELIDQIGSWYNVRLANNEVGWLESSQIELI